MHDERNQSEIDRLLDEQLRRVPLPGDLRRACAPGAARDGLFDDDSIDRLLARVSVSRGLVERLRTALVASLPPVMAAPPRPAIAPPAPRWTGMPRMARALAADFAVVAAALALVVGMFFGGVALSGWLAAVRDPGVASRPNSRRDGVVAGRRNVAESAVSPVAALPAAVPKKSVAPGDGLDDQGTDRAGAESTQPGPDQVAAAGSAIAVRGAPAALVADDAAARATGFFGMRVVAMPQESRREVPRVRGFDLAFEMAHGEPPFVNPSLAPSLGVDRPPLLMRTDSFDWMLAQHGQFRRGSPSTAAGRMHPPAAGPVPGRVRPGSIRVEDVLAAVPFTVDPVASSMRVTLQGMRSLRADPATDLVEVCVTAPLLDRDGDRPLDAVLVLDHSAAPAAAVSWRAVCRGMEMLARQMTPADRLSVVVCGARPRLAAVRGDAATIAGLAAEFAVQPPRGTADFDAAMRMAATAIGPLHASTRMVIVAHADTVERARDEGLDAYGLWQHARASGTVDGTAAVDGSAGGGPVPNFILIDAAAAAGESPAPARIAADPAAIRRAMVAGVFGRSTLVSRRCSLVVAFDPAQVAAYRIVGHRQTVVESLAGGPPEPIDMHAGEAVRVVYEILRTNPAREGRGDAAADAIVSATVSHVPLGFAGPVGFAPTGGFAGAAESADRIGSAAELLVRATLTADAIEGALPSPHACEILLAVSLGEAAGGSVHAVPRRTMSDGLAAVVRAWQRRGDVTSFGEGLIDCLERQNLLGRGTRMTGARLTD